jgi:hypothetical protein
MNTNAKKIATIAGLFSFFILLAGYAFFVSRDLIFGVQIRNVKINGMPAVTRAAVAENVLTVAGNAQNAIHLLLDDREISVDQKGNFTETIALLPGYNILTIRAQDKFGYVDEKNYQLIYRTI